MPDSKNNSLKVGFFGNYLDITVGIGYNYDIENPIRTDSYPPEPTYLKN